MSPVVVLVAVLTMVLDGVLWELVVLVGFCSSD